MKSMRKMLLFVLLGLPFLFNACNNAAEVSSESKTANTETEKNLAAFRAVSEAFKTGDVSKIDSVVAADFVDHTERGDLGRDSLKSMIVQVHKSMPEMKSETIKEMADGDYVFGLFRYKGTSNGEMGMPAGPYDFKSMEVVRFKDGMAVEHWAYMEMTEMMKMMAPKTDTTKKKK